MESRKERKGSVYKTSMATTQHELLAKQLLRAQATVSDGQLHHTPKPASSKPKRPVQGSGRSTRHYRIPHRLPSPTEQQLERREQGWNDRFTRDNTPTQPKRPTRVHRAIDDANDSQAQKERKMREERQQYGSGDSFKCQRPGVGRLVPIVPLALPPRVRSLSHVESSETKELITFMFSRNQR
jgi:hypothetical protein